MVHLDGPLVEGGCSPSQENNENEPQTVILSDSPSSSEQMEISDVCSSSSSGVAIEGSVSPRSPQNNSPQNSETSASSLSIGVSIPNVQSSGIEKRHICEMCGKAFPYLSILESHKRCHTGEKPFECHFCDKKFAQKATLQVHERTHTGERPYKCRYCEKTFAQYGTKTVHEKSAHLGIRNYKCPKCAKCLSSPSALYTHKKTHGEKTFHCDFCPKTFTLKNYLKLHVKQVHEQNERKHICNFCSKSFAYAGSLQVHIRTHTGERPYICRYCPKAFASQGNLQSHERTHTGERPYTCDQCGRSFIQKSQLTAHEATHGAGAMAPPSSGSSSIEDSPPLSVLPETKAPMGAGASPASSGGGDYQCKYCGKRYAYASSLYVHTRLHTGERPFSCLYCSKTFTNQGNMQVHQRVHTGEKPYKCVACDRCYAQKVGLKIHQEQCQPFLSMNIRNSESPVNVDSEEYDGSDEKPGNLYVPTPLLQSLPSQQSSLPSQPSLNFDLSAPLSAFPFTTTAAAPESVDFGPLAGSKPPPLTLPLSSESFSAFHAPNQSPSASLLKGILDHQQLLSTQLLLQQMQQTDQLVSLLGQLQSLPSTPLLTPGVTLPSPLPQLTTPISPSYATALLSGLPQPTPIKPVDSMLV